MSNSYWYPNSSSYIALRTLKNRTGLHHGRIYSVAKVQLPTSFAVDGTGEPLWSYTTLNFELSKDFQFNPPELEFNISTVPVDPSATLADSGQSGVYVAMGQASASLKLLFNREREVFFGGDQRAAPSNLGGEDKQAVLDSKTKYDNVAALGVQQDVYDLYRVLLGSSAETLPDSASLKDMTGQMFDLAAAGRQLYANPVAVAFNDQLVIYGMVAGLAVSFPKFNANLVPVMANVSLSLDILNITNTAVVATTMTNDATVIAPGLSVSSASSGSGSGSGSTDKSFRSGVWTPNGGAWPLGGKIPTIF